MMTISPLTQRRAAAQQRWQAAQAADLLITVGVGTCGLPALLGCCASLG